MTKKLGNKLIASILVIAMSFANVSLLGNYSYATGGLENQGTTTNNENVEFDSYFQNEKGEKVHSSKQDINKEDLKMYLSIKVKEGYLKEGNIQVTGEKEDTNPNFKMLNKEESLEVIKQIGENKIDLNQINNGQEVVLEIPVVAMKEGKFDLGFFSKENRVTFSGTYIDSKGKENKIEKTVSLKVEWEATGELELAQDIITYTTVEMGEKTQTMLQTSVKASVTNHSLPIANGTVQITVPTMGGSKPVSATVLMQGKYVTSSYNKENGTLTLSINHGVEEDGKVTWVSEEDFLITYLYDTTVAENTEVKLEQKTVANIQAYNATKTELEQENTLSKTVKEKIGNVISFDAKAEGEISKGYLYSNIETPYVVKQTATIGNKDLTDKITFLAKEDNFITLVENKKKETEEVRTNGTTNTNYQKVIIAKANLQNILGTDGSIKAYTQDGTVIGIINKDTTPDENGMLTMDFAGKEITDFILETTKPAQAGTLEVSYYKTIKADNAFSQEERKAFNEIEVQTEGVATLGTKEQAKVVANAVINMTEPTTKANLEIENKNLSTVVTNENVQIKAILQTDSNNYDLYQNPVIEITLPSYVEKISLKDVKMLFTNELKIVSSEVVTNSDGNKVIQVKTEGNQTKYNTDGVTKGPTILIQSDITLDQLTSSREDTITMKVTNEKATHYENDGKAESNIHVVAPTGLVTLNSISNYAGENSKATSLSGQEQIGNLEIKAEAKTAINEISIINNYSNSVQNIRILGRTPFKGNKGITNGEDLGTTFDATLKGTITAQNEEAKENTIIYYSENGEATEDVNNPANGWTTSPTDYSKVKSYLIVLKDYELKAGEMLNFSYEVNLPENLDHNQSAFSTYLVYFDNVQPKQVLPDRQIAPRVGLTTGKGPILNVELKEETQNKDKVLIGQRVKYTITVTNDGEANAEGVKVRATIPENTVYTEYRGYELGNNYITDETVKEKAFDLGTLKPGQSITKTFEILVNQEAAGKKIAVTAIVNATDLGKEISSNTIENTIENSSLTLTEKSPTFEENVKVGQDITYDMLVKNVSDVATNDTVLKTTVPDGTKYKEANILVADADGNISYVTDGISYDEKTKTVIWNIGTLEAGKTKQARLIVTIEQEKQIINQSTVSAQNVAEYNSPKIVHSIGTPKLSITKETTAENKYIKQGQDIEYIITVKNEGTAEAKDVNVKDTLPEGLTAKSYSYELTGTSTASSKDNSITGTELNINETIPTGGTLTITLVATATNVPEGKDEQEIKNTAVLTDEKGNTLQSQTITNIIEKSQEDPNNPDNPDNPGDVADGKYKISGKIWEDTNKNGIIDENEPALSNVEVMLINKATGNYVKDPTTKERKTAKTNENGEYTIDSLINGDYVVVFNYDSDKYSITTYKVEGASEEVNSNAISSKVSEDDQKKKNAITDAIHIEDSSVSYINLGLIKNEKFDLELNKYVSKITVQDSKNTKTYEYDKSKLAKVDLDYKTLNNTTIIVEYKIAVTNTGDIPGYVKKIVDYMPKELEFSSELNKDWYLADNGDIYNSSLADEKINPGETKEVTLVLTKSMSSEDNMTVINNNAEIYESYNDLGVNDNDSTNANKAQGEDDMSSADVLLSLKTGSAVMYITLSITIVALIGVGAYMINKKVLKI